MSPEHSHAELSNQMVYTWIIVLWVILFLWFCIVLVAFRRNILVVLKRLAKLLGIITIWKSIRKCFRGRIM